MNTNYRVGNKVKVSRAVSGIPKGTIVEIINSFPNEPRWTVIKPGTSMSVSLNTRNLHNLTKEESIKSLTEEKGELEEKLKDVNRNIEITTKYEDEEYYLSHKISNILKNKDNPKAIREILKEGYTHLL